MRRVYNKNPVTGETARVTKGIISSPLSKLASHFMKNKTLRSDMRLKDLLRVKVFLSFFLQRGGKHEEIKRNENDISLIPLPVTQPASQPLGVERRE